MKLSRPLALWCLLPLALFGGGWWLRSRPLRQQYGNVKAQEVTTLFFPDGPFLVPVSRRLGRGASARLVLDNLLAGPSKQSGLLNPFHSHLEIRALEIRDGIAQLDLTTNLPGDLDEPARRALVATLTGLPDITSVAIRVNGQSSGANIPSIPMRRTPLAYYASPNGLVAVASTASSPRQMITGYLQGPPSTTLTGLPSDVQLIAYKYDAVARAVWLNLTYRPSLRTLALEQPDRMRFVLLGIIASLTEFPEVATVELNFEGKTRLGVGQCSDLLRTPQRRPELLNDERLLSR